MSERARMNIVRFVILAQPRTGSHLLKTSLEAHPQISCAGEILNHRQAESRLGPPEDGALRLMQTLATGNRQAVGCVLHACQPDRQWPRWRRWESAWPALASDPSIRVIVLRRMQALAQLASWKIAEQTDHWVDQSPFADQRPTVRFDQDELRWFRRWNDALYQWRLSGLSQHPVLEVLYEDLIVDWDRVVRGLQLFLGVEPQSLPQATSKQETRPLAEVIENFSELCPATAFDRRVYLDEAIRACQEFTAPRVLKTDAWNEAAGDPVEGGIAGHLPTPPEHITLVECNAAVLEAAQGRVPGATCVHADIRSLPLAAESFDVVIDASTIDHVPLCDLATVVAEYHRVLVPRGHFCLIAWCSETETGPINAPWRAHHQYYFRAAVVRQTLSAAGFRIEQERELFREGEDKRMICWHATKETPHDG